VGGVDITTYFFQSARGTLQSDFSCYDGNLLILIAAIGPGELVKDDFFTLFESVGALEVGRYFLLQCVGISMGF
jgi:hypothetical protein